VHNLPKILDGDIEEIIDALIAQDQSEKLKTARLRAFGSAGVG
jgi:protein subunit release factor A